MNKNNLVLITAPSAGGKTCLQESLLKKGWKRPINFTTRPMRGEHELDEYVFITEDRFHMLLKRGVLLEHTNYNGNWYGISATLPKGNICIVLDPIGRDQVMEKVARDNMDYNVKTFFINISPETQTARLKARGDSEDLIKGRDNDFKWMFPTISCTILDGLIDSDILANEIIDGLI